MSDLSGGISKKRFGRIIGMPSVCKHPKELQLLHSMQKRQTDILDVRTALQN
jgi:hypothetical protein